LLSITRLIPSPRILDASIDANAPFRVDAIEGKLNSGETLIDEKSADSKSF